MSPTGIADVDLEVGQSQDGGSSRQYRVSWHDEQQTGAADNVTYYVHYCYVNNVVSDLLCKVRLRIELAANNCERENVRSFEQISDL